MDDVRALVCQRVRERLGIPCLLSRESIHGPCLARPRGEEFAVVVDAQAVKLSRRESEPAHQQPS